MLKDIHLAGSVRTPPGSFCGALADVSAVELGKATVERPALKPANVKEVFAGNILNGALHPKTPPRARSGRGCGGGGMGIASGP